MRRWLGPLATGFVAAAACHAAALHFTPAFIMDRAYTLIGESGVPIHAFRLAPQMRPDTQTVVRPSPDLAYSICRFDLDRAPDGLRVVMAASNEYSSVSFYDARTNNFLTIRGKGKTREATLYREGSRAAGTGGYSSPTDKGVVLIRRLAPTDAAYRDVERTAEGDRCEVL
ncbi:DUF1254 domain-containing protein [Erythrobacter ani]|uniref:DUF1254 domain-containing protein n=1 Tax=Erythrobacter ani TaxID=2827235 RepID=A0ABS6SM99_9SPHN|nr:DUF1254 domain-containing protein [Erythrobacter ani]MBV7266112.1 DUF1254 domain-containing protein [Erythrobacter ani]